MKAIKKKSRRMRYENAQQLVVQASDEFEELLTELQDWLDNMPENLQGSAKAEELQDTKDWIKRVKALRAQGMSYAKIGMVVGTSASTINRTLNPEKIKAYRQANKEVIKEKKKAYYRANKEEIKAYQQTNKEGIKTRKAAYRQANKDKTRVYLQANKERIKVRGATYYQANKERIKVRNAAYYQVSKDKIKEQGKNYHLANKERIKKRAKAYCRAHKEEIKTRQAVYQQANKEVIKKKAKAYHQAHKDESKARRQTHREELIKYKGAYYQNNKGKFNAYGSKRRALKKGATMGDLNRIKEIYRIAAEEPRVRDYLTGKLIPMGHRQVDHVVPLSKGGQHRPSNLAVTSDECNLSKHNKMPEEIGLLL